MKSNTYKEADCVEQCSSLEEAERIRTVYKNRDAAKKSNLYTWHRPEVRQQEATWRRIVAALLAETLGRDLSGISALDVGCGTGGFLRTLVEWGAKPGNLVGTEYLEDRLEEAQRRSALGIRWHIGTLEFAETESFNLVTANTVFSSILADSERLRLAAEMWRLIKPGGWIMVFDFRYNNPSNPNVRRVTQKELREYWPTRDNRYRKLLLAPPLARRLAFMNSLVADILEGCIPFLRSHHIYMGKK